MSNNKDVPVQVAIKIDGSRVSTEFLEDILQISVEQSLHSPSMFMIILRNEYFPGREQQDKAWKHEEFLKIGKSITLDLQGSKTAQFNKEKKSNIFEGEITAIECQFDDNSQAPIVIRGYDLSHRLHRGRHNRSFQNMTDGDIVRKITQEVGITPGDIKSGDIVHEYLFQENQTNMEFLRERAFRLGFELYIKENKLFFCPPQDRGKLQLTWLKEINSFRVKVNSAEQVSSVEVRGWNYKEKIAITATATNDEVITENKNGKGKNISSKFNTTPQMIVVDQPIFETKEAEKMAQSLCNELGGEFISADAMAEGNSEITVGKVIELGNMGQYNGKYYITETRHLYHRRIYTTEFTCRGLRGDNILSLLSPPTHLQPGQTLLVGIVTDNQDPQKMGRVKVKFPTLTEDHNSNWARMVALGAGDDRGFDSLPEINDEVLVGFEHGDIHRPYIIGGVWNGKDHPPESVDDSVQGNKVRLRTFKTRTGHILQFVEEDKAFKKAGVYVTSTKGHQIMLNDSERHIQVKTMGGHSVKMDDTKQEIHIKTSGGHSVKMSDAGQEIAINSTGNISIKATGNIEMSANGTITIKGAMIFLN